MSTEFAQSLSLEYQDKDIKDVLMSLSVRFNNDAVFTTSFGIEDQVISHSIFENNINIKVATLDTGRIFKETYKTYNRTL